jgi:hypothetical protein
MQNLQFGLLMWAAFMACTAVDTLTGTKSSSKKVSTTGSSSSGSTSPAATTKVTTARSGTGKTVRQLLAKALPASSQ